MSFSKKWR